ncbi:MAG: hypothetical protein GKR93_10920 [Gammaproteobacteria bacterium]|nr:hypothetical protein [Gammaproteobacteria bacterium]
MRFRARRFWNFTALVIASLLITLAFEIVDLSLRVPQYYSGWLMIILFATLFAFYLKKRLSIIPMGSSSLWAQWHYYLGLFSLIVFLNHINFSVPAGKLELLMSTLFLLVLASGIGGLLINRHFAKRLSYLSEEIIYERIPGYNLQLKNEVESLITNCVEKSGSTTLADYYIRHLSEYFHRPRFIISHLLGSNYAIERIVAGLQNQMRYLNKEEADYALLLKNCIERKRMLDTHFALQSALKYWGISHAPLALSLMIFISLHMVLVYAFRGAA